MFERRKKTYTRKTKSVSTSNTYNEPIETYTAATSVRMFISLSNEMTMVNQDMRIQQCSHIGLTRSEIGEGDLIDDKYLVQFINKAGREKIVFMKEIENNGSFG